MQFILMAHAPGKVVIMGHDNKCRASLTREAEHEIVDALRILAVKIPCGFISQDTPGLIDECSRNRDPLTLPAREL
mgnify:FL=1